MAIDTLRGKTASLRRSFPRPNLSALTRHQRAPMPSYGIGDADAHVFNCPVCARPLPDGTFKCPGCSTHLVFGVTLKRAGGLLSFGLVVGILFGGLAMSVAIGLGLPSTSAAGNGTTGITQPGAAPAATADPVTGIVPDTTVPKAALSAMRQIALLDQRIAEDGAALKSAVKANRTADIARLLRALGADAAVGAKYVDPLKTWSAASDIATSRQSFYDSIGTTSQAGLDKSLSNKKAYKASGTAMLKVLKKVAVLDTEGRALAVGIGTELPPVDYSAIK